MIAPNRRILRFLLALVVLTYLLAGAQDILERLGATPRPNTPAGTTAEVLAGLTVTSEANEDSFDRGRFGDGWATAAGGCNTRSRVLLDESVAPARVDGCEVLAGQWVSIYDGVETTDPASLDINHLVPLAEAWASGASGWTDRRREAFANDTDPTRPDALIAVTSAGNQAKGDSDPAEWLPPDPGRRCWYGEAWIRQKATWNLSVDQPERQALTAVLAACPAETMP